MRNLYFSTLKSNYLILEIDKNQKLISDLSMTVKTEGKLEKILLKTYFKDLHYDLIGELNENFDPKKNRDFEIDTNEKLNEIFLKNNIKLNLNSIYYIFKEIKNG